MLKYVITEIKTLFFGYILQKKFKIYTPGLIAYIYACETCPLRRGAPDAFTGTPQKSSLKPAIQIPNCSGACQKSGCLFYNQKQPLTVCRVWQKSSFAPGETVAKITFLAFSVLFIVPCVLQAEFFLLMFTSRRFGRLGVFPEKTEQHF